MTESLEKLRQQYDSIPYAKMPLEQSPRGDYNALFVHSMVTPYYLRHRKVIDTQGKVILDAGCGGGYTSLMLAEANPGARIVGVDLSEESVKMARERLAYHHFDNVEFHALSIEDLPQLGQTFDYINCDEVLYLIPDPLRGLQTMQSVLNPEGIIRANLHSALQRAPFYRAQEIFREVGLMDGPIGAPEVQVVINTMQALKPDVMLKVQTWQPSYSTPEGVLGILVNHLLLGDKGFTIPQLFELLEQSNLDLISLVNWRHWEVSDLFQQPDDLPAFWAMSLMGADLPNRLRIYELLHPVNRLIDFWCTQAEAASGISVDQWEEADWQGAIAHLHPQLRTEDVKQALLSCIAAGKPFEFTQFIDLPAMGLVTVESAIAACLLPLWEAPQPISALVDRYLKTHPVHPATLEPTSEATAWEMIQQLLNRLDAFLYVLLEAAS